MPPDHSYSSQHSDEGECLHSQATEEAISQGASLVLEYVDIWSSIAVK